MKENIVYNKQLAEQIAATAHAGNAAADQIEEMANAPAYVVPTGIEEIEAAAAAYRPEIAIPLMETLSAAMHGFAADQEIARIMNAFKQPQSTS